MDGRRAPVSRRASLLLALPPLAFVALFFVWPLVGVLRLGLVGPDEPVLTVIGRVWTEPHVVDVLLFTVGLAVASTVLTVLLGLPAAWVFARFEFPGRRTLRALTVVPFVLPTVVVGAAFLALLGPRSPLNALGTLLAGDAFPQVRLDGSVAAILVAHVFYNLAVVVRIVASTWERLDPRVEEAARMLGASPLRAFREVTWPRLVPSVLSAASIVLLFTATSFGVVLLLGGPRDTTLEVEIYRQAAIVLDLPAAAALTLIQLVGVAALLLTSARAQERSAIGARSRVSMSQARRPRTRGERLAVAAIVGALAAFLVLPLIVLLERSVAGPRGYGLEAWSALLVEDPRNRLPIAPIEAVVESLSFAVFATAVAATLGLCAAVAVAARRGWLSRALDALLTLPLGTSAVIVGFGFLVALDLGPVDLRTSVVLIPLAHALIALPFVLRVVAPIVRSIDPRLREAAAVLGASPGRAWRAVDAPILARGAAVGAGFAFAVSLGEFGATLFIARPESTTIPVAIYRLLGQPGATTFATAMALATVLMALTVAVMLLVDRARVPGEGAL
jgi:thiamine transport system permease protein